jgi:broad specificity phosphatase PhoE
MMRRPPELLILVRHARPEVDASMPRVDWTLGEEGLAAAARLAEQLRPIGVDVVVSSTERKAKDTGAVIAHALGVTFQTGQDLDEHRRPRVGLLSDEVFGASMRDFFARPDQRVFGDESAAAAQSRFGAAVDALVKAHHGRRLVVVTHGTVLALHLAARYSVDAWSTWQRLGQPAYVVVEQRTKTIVDIVTAV